MEANKKARMAELKQKIDQGKEQRAKAEAALEHYTQQRQQVEREIRELGYDPANLDEAIAGLEAEVDEHLGNAEALMRDIQAGAL